MIEIKVLYQSRVVWDFGEVLYTMNVKNFQRFGARRFMH